VEGAAPPDIKDRAEIRVCVSYIEDFNNISDKAHVDPRFANLFLIGGEGIGTASGGRPGYLDGEALIEKPVRDSVFETVANVCDISDGAQLLLITVSCPGGMMIAAGNTMGQNTFAGGITIMGEHATISKIHQRDISDSIDFQIKKQVDLGVSSVLVSPGNYCADKINTQLHVPLTTAAHCYNYPGQAIDSCVAYGVTNMLLVGNVGKLVKLAAGITNTNSFASDGRREIFAAHTAIIGGTSSQVRTVMNCLTCDEILALLTNWGLRDRVMSSIMNSIAEYCNIRSRGRLNLAVALFSEEFGLLGSTINTKNVLVKVSQEQFALSLKLK
jgi:cobalt-precorrin-5B (C1)-methyltransferase